MAFGARIINPIDTRPSTAVGVSLPFNGNTGFNSTFTTRDAIKNNLINYFLTNTGDRYDNPNFGGDLRQYIFEQIEQDTFDSIKEDIQAKVNTYFPSITINDIEISQTNTQTDLNTVIVSITYDIVGTGNTDTLLIGFS